MNYFRTDEFAFEPIGEKPAGDVLCHATALLEAAGIDYWLSCGTALALYRDGDIIKTDTDIDVGVRGDVGDLAIYSALNFPLVQGGEYGGKTQSMVFMIAGVLFDVGLYHRAGAFYENMSTFGLMRKPAHLIDDLSTINYRDRTFKCPKMPDYLTFRYGNWEIPSGTKWYA